jgi:hypothetical protein
VTPYKGRYYRVVNQGPRLWHGWVFADAAGLRLLYAAPPYPLELPVVRECQKWIDTHVAGA